MKSLEDPKILLLGLEDDEVGIRNGALAEGVRKGVLNK